MLFAGKDGTGRLVRRGASVSALNVSLTLFELDMSFGLVRGRSVNVDDACSRGGVERFCGEFLGVASRSRRLMSDARSFVAASKIESTPAKLSVQHPIQAFQSFNILTIFVIGNRLRSGTPHHLV